MKQFFTFFILFFAINTLSAQNISVKSFRSLDTDLDARVYYPKTDQNGEKAAIIKVVTTQKGFKFDVGSLAVLTVDYKDGEIWVYVPRGIRKITITHPQLGILRDYPLEIPIQAASVYELVLTTLQVETVLKEKEIEAQYLVVESVPSGAEVYLNGNLMGNTPFSRLLEEGEYELQLKLDSYHTHKENIKLESEKISKNINLKPNFGDLYISSSPEQGMNIIIDGKSTGLKTPNTIKKLKSGNYEIKLGGEWYMPATKNVVIQDGKEEKLEVKMQANFGTIKIDAQPSTSKIYIDDKVQTGSSIEKRLLPGLYNVKIEADKYTSENKIAEIKVGETINYDFNLKPKTGNLDVNVLPFDAEIYLDSKLLGKSPDLFKNILVGNYELKVKKEGYSHYIEKIEIKENETLKINYKLEENLDVSTQILSSPSDAKVYIDGKYRGTTPLNIDKIKEGSYDLRLEKNNYDIHRSTLTLKRGEKNSVYKYLKISEGELKVYSEPFSADIYIDNQYKGTTNANLKLPAGNYLLRVQKKGYQTVNKSVQVKAGDSKLENIKLKKVKEKKDRNDFWFIHAGTPLIYTGINGRLTGFWESQGFAVDKTGPRDKYKIPLNLYLEKKFSNDLYAIRLNVMQCRDVITPHNEDKNYLPLLDKTISLDYLSTNTVLPNEPRFIQKNVVSTFFSFGIDLKLNIQSYYFNNLNTFIAPSLSYRTINIKDGIDKLIPTNNNANFETVDATQVYNFSGILGGGRIGQMVKVHKRFYLTYEVGLLYNSFRENWELDYGAILGIKL